MTMSELKSRMLNRKEVRAIKEKRSVDLHSLMLDVLANAKGSDINEMDLLKKLTPEIVDSIVDHTYPANEAQLDSMSYLQLTNLTVEILAKTFGGELEKK